MLGEAVETDDASEWAGWIFADMLVGLMVVFLATITFVSVSKTSVSDSNGDYTYTEHFEQQFTAIYMEQDVSNLTTDIKFFLISNQIPENAVIDSAMFIGGETIGQDTAGHGVDAALKFSNAVDKAYPDLLKHASTTLNSSADVGTDRVAVVLTFSANVSTNR